MRVLITGAAGMIGRKLAGSIAETGQLGGRAVTALDLVDVVMPDAPNAAPETRCLAADLSDPASAAALIGRRPDVIVHLAAIPSGGAEQFFDQGYSVNFDGTRHLLDAVKAVGRKAPYCPKVVFSSTIAVFGAPFPDRIGDEFLCAPLTSYGAQKVMGEMLLSDYSRRGVLDGIALRLPTICVRPGKPNLAASGFFSNILREPLNGIEANLPVSEDTRHWFASPRAAVGFIHHATGLDTARVGPRRALNMPGLSAKVAEQIAALERVAGAAATRLISRTPDPAIAEIVAGWPRDFDTRRALELGFRAETDFDQIIRAHVEDELGGALPAIRQV